MLGLLGVTVTLAVVVPAPASGAVTLGADLSTMPELTTVCAPGLPGCNLTQLQSVGVNQAAPFDGVVVLWRMKSASGPMKLRVIRPVGGDTYNFVSSGPIESASGAGVETFPARLPIKVGEYVGVELTSSTATVSSDDAGTHLADRAAVWPSINPDGSSSNFPVIFEGGRVYMNADVEPDADADVFGDESQDGCPGLAGGTNGCPPATTLTKQPKRKTMKKKARFAFSSDVSGATFECSLDGEPFEACATPDAERVKKGRHEFEVRAKDAEGFVDPTPARATWKLKKKK